MSGRSNLVLLAATVVAVGACSYALWAANLSPAPAGPGAPLFPAMGAENADITDIAIEAPGYSLVLERSGDGWKAASLDGYPARTEPATELVADIAALRALEAKTGNPDWYALIGVEDREATGARSTHVRIADGATVLADALIGKPAASLGSDPLGGTFVRRTGEAQAWLGSGLVEVPQQLRNWFEPVLAIRGTDIEAVAIFEDDSLAIEVGKAAGQPGYSLVSSAPAYAGEGTFVDTALVQRMEQALLSVSFEAVRRQEGTSPSVPARRLAFTTAGGLLVEVETRLADGTPWVTFHASAPEGSEAAQSAAAINARAEGWAFRLGNASMLALMAAVPDLLNPEPPAPPADGAGQLLDPSLFGQPRTP